MKNNYTTGLGDLLQLFEDNVSVSDINGSRYLGKISAAIVRKRIEMGMTQKQFSQYLGVSQGMVSKWEGGDYNFTIRALAEIAEKLNLELYLNLKEYEERTADRGLNTEFAYLTSEKKQFISVKSNVISFGAWKSSKYQEMTDNKEM